MNDSEVQSLRNLARGYGVLTRYRDGFYRQKEVSPEALLAVLRELGAPLHSIADAPTALRERHKERWQQLAEPVIVSWGTRPEVPCVLRTPAGDDNETILCTLELASGEKTRWPVQAGRSQASRRIEIDGNTYCSRILSLPGPLPYGYHHLRLEYAGKQTETLIISAPRLCYVPADQKRSWGVFLPLYALQTERSWGAGDLTDLEMLTDWVRSLGGTAVGTLPLLTAFLDFPYDPSPYSPASRLFWNEFYIDVTGAPEFAIAQEARHLVHSAAWKAELEELRRGPFVDAKRIMALKRRVLEEMAKALLSRGSSRRIEFERYVDSRPVLEKYAQFRATVEKRRQVWHLWPDPLHSGYLRPDDFDGFARTYHLYVQWLADQQLAKLAKKARGGGTGLYLDLPLGVHPDGFDVWSDADSFAMGVAGGAPPDRFFTKGQNWGFAPLNPTKTRIGGHQHWIACLRHHMQHAGVLRIDHVMGLHRLYWVPQGMEANEGTYVQYPADELYAVLSLESHQHETVIVGEDLGTVPPYIRRSMSEHGLRGMYVTQFEVDPNPEKAMHTPPARAFASMNSHDTAMFAAFWDEADIASQIDLGLLNAEEAENDRRWRRSIKDALVQFLRNRGRLDGSDVTSEKVLMACLCELAASDAEFVVVTLEDLWGEREPQNTPGTVSERVNWRRRARLSYEDFKQKPEVLDLLRQIDELRRQRQSAQQ